MSLKDCVDLSKALLVGKRKCRSNQLLPVQDCHLHIYWQKPQEFGQLIMAPQAIKIDPNNILKHLLSFVIGIGFY